MAETMERRGRITDLAMEPLPGEEQIDTKSDYMMSPRQSVLTQMVHRVASGYTYWRPIYEDARGDVEFIYGDQWPEEAKEARQDRPMLQINHVAQFIHTALGNLRKNKFNLHVRQSAGPNDRVVSWMGDQGSNYSISEIMEGLIRDVENRSMAGHAYIRAVQHALEGGFGWLWVRTDQLPDNPFEIELQIEHIKDRYSVIMDPFAEKDDFSDADWGIISTKMPMREFRARYPEVPQASWNIGDGFDTEYRDWWGGEAHARVCHYFYKEPMKRTAWRLRGTDGTEIVAYKDKLEDILDELAAGGYTKVDEKDIDSFQMKHIKCTSNNILEGPNDWPGLRVPIVPVLGREINYENRASYAGLLRWTHDSQRMINYLVSSFIERVALSPKAPWVATEEQIAGHEGQWYDQHKRNVSVLLYKHDSELENPPPAPQRQEPASMPAAEMQGILGFRTWMQDAVGMHEANLGKRSNETSGVAIQRRQDTGNMAIFDFVDNLAFSIASVGNLLCDLIPKIYSGDAIRRIVLPDDSQTLVRLNYQVQDEESGKTIRVSNLDLCRYTCTVRPGPAFQTMREQFVQMFMEIGRSNPQFAASMFDLFVANLDMPYGREMTRRAKMQIPRHLLSEEDQQNIPEPPPPQPTPEQQAEMAKAEATQAKAQSDAYIADMDAQMKRDEMAHQEEIERLKLEQQREQTRQQELRTEQTGVQLEVATEKGAAEIAKGDREAASEEGEEKISMADVRREISRAIAESRRQS